MEVSVEIERKLTKSSKRIFRFEEDAQSESVGACPPTIDLRATAVPGSAICQTETAPCVYFITAYQLFGMLCCRRCVVMERKPGLLVKASANPTCSSFLHDRDPNNPRSQSARTGSGQMTAIK
jgi:hypothetical protein